MKGIIFNLAQEVVTDAYGEDVWDDLLQAAGVEGAYTSLGSYPDEELLGLVAAASSALGMSNEAVLRQIAEGAMPLLAGRFPDFFQGHGSTRAFLLTLNQIIHPEVRKLYPGAQVPDFDFDTSSEEVLLIGYRSHRKLCALAEGFIEGAARHYGEEATLDQITCMNRGDERCLIRCAFTAP